MSRAAIDRTIDAILDALGRGVPVDPAALTLLLRCYRATDRDDLRAALEPALSDALERSAVAASVSDQAAWLVLFAEARSLSEDDRIRRAVDSLMSAVRRARGRPIDPASLAVSVEACLRAASSPDADGVVREAVDELERLASAAYRPGDGIVRPDEHAGGPRLDDQLAMASALLAAYAVTDRLPYAMLAEELVQVALHRFWNADSGRFVVAASRPEDVDRWNADAARVLGAMADLHDEAEYRRAAIVCDAGPQYRAVAATILDGCDRESAHGGPAAAAYALALLDRALRKRTSDEIVD